MEVIIARFLTYIFADTPIGYFLIGGLAWFGRDIYNFFKSMNHIKREWDSVKDTLKVISSRLSNIEDILNVRENSFASSNSPQHLNDAGVKVADEIAAYEIAERCVPHVLSSLKGIANAYDIQQGCFNFVSDERFFDYLREAEEDIIKETAFNKGVPQSMLLRVIGLVMRDRILKEKNIPLAQVDSDTPTK